jgi:pentose-5-phosphate-3-epimerase
MAKLYVLQRYDIEDGHYVNVAIFTEERIADAETLERMMGADFFLMDYPVNPSREWLEEVQAISVPEWHDKEARAE